MTSLLKGLRYVQLMHLQLVVFILSQVPTVGQYSTEDHVLANVIAEIKEEWPCRQKLHGTCIDTRNSHVQIHRIRMREWASRIVSFFIRVSDNINKSL